MGTCKSVDTAELIEIRSSLNKQNESIQSLINSTKHEFNTINHKISHMESQINSINSHQNTQSLQQQVADLSKQLDKVHATQKESLLSASNGSKSSKTPSPKESTEKESSDSESQKHDAFQRKFPKPRTVKLYSHGNVHNNHTHSNDHHRSHSKSVNPTLSRNDSNDQQLNAINLKLDSMRNAIRRQMTGAQRVV
mmetsp:Transcript_2132/g.3446  ORF Transcript_2132/g.3446 Transcript_2132/m.3446 type:complete len:195 (-) Transcript_2132:295-879(-)